MNLGYEQSLQLVSKELLGTPFESESRSVLSHFTATGTNFPYVSDAAFREICLLLGIHQDSSSMSFTFIDLFAGIGGFRLGLEKYGGKALFSSEWERHARETYLSNHGEYPFGDINTFTNESVSDNELSSLVPDHDILAGGFPCQPFSLAGVSARNALGLEHGFRCSTQGTLFYSIERIARVKRPKILFLENVKNLISHDGGRTFSTIKNSIETLGYKFFHKLVNSETVVPQRRVRCFMVCVRQDVVEAMGDFEFPDFSGEALPLKTILDDAVDDMFTISDRLWSGHQNRSKRNADRGTGFTTKTADLEKPANTIVARYGKDGKECLIPQRNKNPRMLTVAECRRLFGLPEEFQLPASRTPAYKLLGNSVVLPVVERISKKIVTQYVSSTSIPQ